MHHVRCLIRKSTSDALIGLPHDKIANRCRCERAVRAGNENTFAIATDLLVEILVGQGRCEVLKLVSFLKVHAHDVIEST